MSRRLKREFGPRDWLADGASRKRVRDGEHLDYLMQTYIPSHRGLYWRKDLPEPTWGDPSLRRRRPR